MADGAHKLAWLLLLTAATARGEPLLVSAEPALLQLGVSAEARVTVRGPPGVQVHLSSNCGSLGQVRETAAGVYEAVYQAPHETYPRVAVISAWGQREKQFLHGVAALPLWGQGMATVTTRPKARVTLRIGERDFGPVQADARGQGEVFVQVPPGTTHALHGNRAIDLGLPVTSRLHLVTIPSRVSADAPSEVTLRVYSVSLTGTPESATVRLRVPGGTLGPLRQLSPGIAEATWSVPALEPGSLEPIAWAAGAKGAPASATLQVGAGPATVVELAVDRTDYIAGEDRPIALTLRQRDAKGRPGEDEVLLETDFGTIDLEERRPGETRARLRVPDRFEGRGELTLSARAGAVTTRATVRLVAGAASEVRLPALKEMRARDTVSIRGAGFDSWGNAVSTAPTVTAERGVAGVSSSDRTGFVVSYTAPSTRNEETADLEVSLAGVRQRRSVAVVPRPALLTLSLKGGYATNFGVISAPSGGLEVGGWTELGGQHVGLALEGSVLASWARTPLEASRTLSSRTLFVPVLLSLSLDVRLPRQAWLRPALGGGVSALFHRTMLDGGPWVEESGLGASAQVSVQAGFRAVAGGPFVELRALYAANPGLATLQGPLVSMWVMGGYTFEAL